MAQRKLLFITGVGRSGTSLLQSMLNAHPQIHIPPETHFFKRYILPYLWHKKLPQPSELKADTYLQRLPEQSRSKLFKALSGESVDISSAFTGIMAGLGSPAVAGDKDTEYVRYLPHLRKLYPKAFLLHIKRDPRDVIASRKKADWSKKRSVAFHAAEYQYYIRKVEEEGPRFFGERYFAIRYEDLLQQPQDTLQPILRKLDLDFQISMLDYHKTNEKLVANDEKSWKQNLDKPLLKSNFNKWKQELTTSEIALVQNGLEDFFRANGYELVPAFAGFWQLAKRKAIKGLFGAKTFKEKLD